MKIVGPQADRELGSLEINPLPLLIVTEVSVLGRQWQEKGLPDMGVTAHNNWGGLGTGLENDESGIGLVDLVRTATKVNGAHKNAGRTLDRFPPILSYADSLPVRIDLNHERSFNGGISSSSSPVQFFKTGAEQRKSNKLVAGPGSGQISNILIFVSLFDRELGPFNRSFILQLLSGIEDLRLVASRANPDNVDYFRKKGIDAMLCS